MCQFDFTVTKYMSKTDFTPLSDFTWTQRLNIYCGITFHVWIILVNRNKSSRNATMNRDDTLYSYHIFMDTVPSATISALVTIVIFMQYFAHFISLTNHIRCRQPARYEMLVADLTGLKFYTENLFIFSRVICLLPHIEVHDIHIFIIPLFIQAYRFY